MDNIHKKECSETDICDLFITPAIKSCRMGPRSADPARGDAHARPGYREGQSVESQQEKDGRFING